MLSDFLGIDTGREVIFNAEKVSAAEYIAELYVSPDGSDTNDGSFSAPFLTNTSLEGNYSANGDFNSDYTNGKADISNMIYYFLGKIADLID